MLTAVPAGDLVAAFVRAMRLHGPLLIHPYSLDGGIMVASAACDMAPSVNLRSTVSSQLFGLGGYPKTLRRLKWVCP